MSSFLSPSYILKITLLFDVGLIKTFYHFVGCCLSYWWWSLPCRSFFLFVCFMRSCLLTADLNIYTIGILLRKLSPMLRPSSLFSTFFSFRISLSEFMLRSFIYLDFCFVDGDRSICILLYSNIQLHQSHSLKMLSFFKLYNFGFDCFVKF